MNLPAILPALAALLAVGQAGDGGSTPARQAVQFEKHAEHDCDWTMRDASGRLIRGSIRPGEQSPVLQIFDPMFDGWSDSDYPTVELSTDKGAPVDALAYVIHSAPTAGSYLGIFLDEQVRAVVGSATHLQMRKDGTPVIDLALADTPSAEELAACVSEGD